MHCLSFQTLPADFKLGKTGQTQQTGSRRMYPPGGTEPAWIRHMPSLRLEPILMEKIIPPARLLWRAHATDQLIRLEMLYDLSESLFVFLRKQERLTKKWKHKKLQCWSSPKDILRHCIRVPVENFIYTFLMYVQVSLPLPECIKEQARNQAN